MNNIRKQPISSLGYDFIPKEFIPKGKDEYYLRNIQHRSSTKYRQLTRNEIKTLEANANDCPDWTKVLVSEAFNPDLVKNCAFFGLVRIGKLENYYAEFNNLRLPVGLYNSTIISCDLGDNVVVDNVNFLSHYIIGNEVMLVNINEMGTTDHSKFGNGVLKKGEKESVRIWLEVCNENAGRSILPFNGMLAADAWLWSKYRDNDKLLQKFKEFTDKKFDTKRGYYGKVGDRTVIKNCSIIKDVWIGSDAYIKGANKIKNLTINSSPEAKSQIGEGCELVNGIVGYGCRIFYGVKAVRFILGSNSQLKYGARLINSYLGENSTISCCEVLNSLIFPAHEQHHNNSFLCAAVIMGQSNMAAGATIGSNHNSRGADGEIIAGRGFWPGLCVSLKHNSKFATFTLIAKSDYASELNIPIPFSLVSNDISNNKLCIMPAYWFMYNMYALARNAGKYESRDKRPDKMQALEYDYLAPDSVNEIMDSLSLMRKAFATAYANKNKKQIGDPEKTGRELLEKADGKFEKMEVLVEGFENSDRKVQLIKVPEAYSIFRRLVIYYGVNEIIKFVEAKKINNWTALQKSLPSKPQRTEWKNLGGQLMPVTAVKTLINNITGGKVNSWDDIHDFYMLKSLQYHADKFRHAWACLLEVLNIPPSRFSRKLFLELLNVAIATQEWIEQSIIDSRSKDYTNEFRKMVYDNDKEMNKVLGNLNDNAFIKETRNQTSQFREKVKSLLQKFSQ